MRQRADDEIPRVQIARRLVADAEILGDIDLRFDRGDDRAGDLVLDGEHVVELAFILGGPDLIAGCGIGELCSDANPLATLADAAFEHVAHAEFLGDLLDVNGPALVGEGGIAGDHEEPPHLRQGRENILADAVAEILLLGIVAHVLECEHGDRRAVRYGQQRRLRLIDALSLLPGRLQAGRLYLHLGDESKTLAGQGANELLRLP